MASEKQYDPIEAAPAPDTSPALSASTRDLDDSYEIYKQNTSIEIDAAASKRVLRKIDLRLLPLLFFIYLLQYLDKNSLNFASVYGLEKGTGLTAQDYSWLNSIFYFGYLVAQYPAGYALQRLPIGKVISCITLVWGAILMTTPACYNFAGIATNRFMLGLTEATINPGFVLIMSMYYTSAEQPLRLEAYYCSNGIATMFGGLIGYAVGHITSGLPKWMYVFLIFGTISIVIGIASFIFLPDLPSTAKFLDARERAIAVERVAANRQGVKNHHFKWYQAVQTARDPKTWILFVMATGAQIPNSALTSFTSLIIKSFGVGTLGTQYLQIPGGAVQFLALIIGGWIATKFASKGHVRSWVMIFANCVCIVGAGMLVGLPNTKQHKWGRLVGVWLCYFQGLSFSMSLTVVSSNVAGYTKKQLTGAALFVGYCVGNIIGPQTFQSSQAPGYHGAYIAMLVGYIVKTVCVIILYAYMWSENKKRDRKAALSLSAGGLSTTQLVNGPQTAEEREAIEKGMLDVTELDNPGFRYIL